MPNFLLVSTVLPSKKAGKEASPKKGDMEMRKWKVERRSGVYVYALFCFLSVCGVPFFLQLRFHGSQRD